METIWKQFQNRNHLEEVLQIYFLLEFRLGISSQLCFRFQSKQGFPTSKSVEVGTLINLFNVFPVGTVDGSEIRRSPVELDHLPHYLQGFIHPRWLFGISEPSTVFKEKKSTLGSYGTSEATIV